MAWGSPAQSAFATFLILCPTSFCLGVIFSLFPYDYPLLWTPSACPPEAFTAMETHLRILHASPNLIPRILHTIIGIGLLGFFMKLYRPSESNVLFDGASLALYMLGVVFYMANTIKGLRVVAEGKYDVELVEGETVVGVKGAEHGIDTVGRADSLRVLAASNTILALVLVGVLVLQAGQWYAERKQRQESEQAEATKSRSSADSAGSSATTPSSSTSTGASSSGGQRGNGSTTTRRTRHS